MLLVWLISFVVSACRRFRHCLLLVVFIEEITLEHGLGRRILQVNLIFFHCIGILPLLIVHMVLIKVIVLITRQESWLQSSLMQCLPIKISEPWMRFHVGISIETQSARCFSLQAFVDEVSCFDIPVFWNLIFSDMCLLGQYSISDLLSTLALVRSATEHAFPGNDTYCKVICRNTVIVLAHDFRCHIAWCSTRLIWIISVRNPFSSYSKVC